MKVKKASVPIFNIQLSNLEATSALNACKACEESLAKLATREELTSYEKASLAFSQAFQKILRKQGAEWYLDEVEDTYPSQFKRGRQTKTSPAKSPPLSSPPPSADPEAEYEDELKNLIADDQELLQAE